MESFFIHGGRPLVGTVQVSGSKNAALPLLFSTLMLPGVSVLSGVPNIRDVDVACQILLSYGAQIEMPRPGVYRIDTANVTYTQPPVEAVHSLRASTYLLGASLSRFGRVKIQPFGGRAFSRRPIDLHLKAIEAFGGHIDGDTVWTDGLHGGKISFPVPSVGATVNALLLSVVAKGDSEIENPAREPHILALLDFLCAAGATITQTSSSFFVQGKPLHGASAHVIADEIEACTYLSSGIASGGRVCVEGISPDRLSFFTRPLAAAGACVDSTENSVTVCAARPLQPLFLTASPFPGIPTDVLPFCTSLLATQNGGTLTDTVFSERFGYLEKLRPFGVSFERKEAACTVKSGPLHGAITEMPDLRGGAATILCALAAEGESRIDHGEILRRGYERPVEKWRSLGADIRMEKT